MMQRDLINATITGIIGTLFLALGVAALYDRSVGVGIVLACSGTFLLLSAYLWAGCSIRNTRIRTASRMFTFLVCISVVWVALLSGVAGTILYPRKAVGFVISSFWLLVLLTAFRNLMRMIRTKKT